MKYGLSDQTIKKIIDVFGKFPNVSEVIIYGSRAKGNFKNGSDIDLSFKGNNLTLRELNKIDMTCYYLMSLIYQFLNILRMMIY